MSIEGLEVLILDWGLHGWVSWGARRNVLVDGRCLVVPADAHPCVVGHDNAVMHSQDATGAGLSGHVRLALGGVLSGHDELNEERVRNFGAVLGLGVAGVLELASVRLVLVGKVLKFHLDVTVGT